MVLLTEHLPVLGNKAWRVEWGRRPSFPKAARHRTWTTSQNRPDRCSFDGGGPPRLAGFPGWTLRPVEVAASDPSP